MWLSDIPHASETWVYGPWSQRGFCELDPRGKGSESTNEWSDLTPRQSSRTETHRALGPPEGGRSLQTGPQRGPDVPTGDARVQRDSKQPGHKTGQRTRTDARPRRRTSGPGTHEGRLGVTSREGDAVGTMTSPRLAPSGRPSPGGRGDAGEGASCPAAGGRPPWGQRGAASGKGRLCAGVAPRDAVDPRPEPVLLAPSVLLSA